MNNEIKVSVGESEQVLVIREGQALPLKEPLVINITGDIFSVKNFVEKRYLKADPLPTDTREKLALLPCKVDYNLQQFYKDTPVITFDKKNLSISLQVNPQDFYGPSVTGKMEVSEDLKPWGINQNKMFSREQLVKLIRFSKRYFSDAIVHDDVLKAFQNLSLTGNTEIKAASDTRGNRDSQFKKTINAQSVPTSFYLEMPIFEGQPKVKFLVEICMDSSESSVIFWFESIELNDATIKMVDEIFSAQASSFADFVCINK